MGNKHNISQYSVIVLMPWNNTSDFWNEEIFQNKMFCFCFLSALHTYSYIHITYYIFWPEILTLYSTHRCNPDIGSGSEVNLVFYQAESLKFKAKDDNIYCRLEIFPPHTEKTHLLKKYLLSSFPLLNHIPCPVSSSTLIAYTFILKHSSHFSYFLCFHFSPTRSLLNNEIWQEHSVSDQCFLYFSLCFWSKNWSLFFHWTLSMLLSTLTTHCSLSVKAQSVI